MIQKNDLLVLSIFTFITVFVWIVADVYHAVVTSQITEVQQILINPLNPNLDEIAVKNIQNRKR
jgi:hypothetical protein